MHVEADRETYQPIMVEGFRPRDLGEIEARWRKALEAGDDLLVLEDDGRIVGLGHVGGAWMSALYILRSHHRRGFGQALLAELCARARSRGITEIGFQCVVENVQALAFYEAQGARRVGRTTESEGATTWDEFVMSLPTDPAGASRDP